MSLLSTFTSRVKSRRGCRLLLNSFELLFFYFNDALKGFLNRPFFRKRINRYLLGGVVLALYLWYFWFNIKEAVYLGVGLRGADEAELIAAARGDIPVAVSSFMSITILLSVAINYLVTLTKSSIYITNILPFSRKEILLAQKLFKLGVALIGFEAFLILFFPVYTQIQVFSLLDILLLFFLYHVLFIALSLTIDACYVLLARLITKLGKISAISLISFGLDLFFVTIALVLYFNSNRFIIRFMNLSISITQLLSILVLFWVLLLLAIIYLNIRYELNNEKRKDNFYGLVRLPLIKLNLRTTFPALYRHQSFIHLVGLEIIMFLIICSQVGWGGSLHYLKYMTGLLAVEGIYYAGATAGIRRFYVFFRISVFREVVSLLLVGVILGVMPLVLSFYLNGSVRAFLVVLVIYLSATIAGLLFPTTKGNFNEVASTVMTLFLSAALYFVIKRDNILFSTIVFLVLVVVLSVLLANERKVEYEANPVKVF